MGCPDTGMLHFLLLKRCLAISFLWNRNIILIIPQILQIVIRTIDQPQITIE